MSDLWRLTLAEASALLDHREVSVREVLESIFERIGETEPSLCAYQHLMIDEARREAAQADDEIARRGQWRGPLHGIPICIKDLVHTHDAPTEGGSRVLAGFRPPRDAAVVRRLRDGGAVVVGKAVTSAFGFGPTSRPTRNAWNQRYDPGGSSAGSGVAVAAGSAFSAVGTDGGGSIRHPAALNGVLGLKPTCGLVSRSGVIPMSSSLDQVGPITRTALDCALMLGVMAGYDPLDPQSISCGASRYDVDIDKGVEDFRVGVELDYFADPVEPGQGPEVVRRAARSLEEMGATVIEVRIPLANLIEPIYHSIMWVDTSTYHRRWLRQRPHDYDRSSRVLLELGELIPGTHYEMAQRARRLLCEEFRNTFLRHRLDAILAPGWGPAAPISAERVKMFEVGMRPVAANLTGLPAVSVPAGFTEGHLPLAFELFGRPFGEQTLLRIAHTYQLANPWHERRPKIPAAPFEAEMPSMPTSP
jgi:Asp-tRNA(Asn)/Glu-tRNA(Gln) amidotransferase A subunit family amidase